MADKSLALLLASASIDSKVQALQQYASEGGSLLESGSGDIAAYLTHEDVSVRAAAVHALCALPSPSQSIVSQVAHHLSADSAGTQCAAALVLAGFGDAAGSQAASVAKLLQDSSEDSADAMLFVGCVKARPRAELRSPKCAAAGALASVGAKGWSYASGVAQLLQDKDVDVRAAALNALGMMGSEGAAHEQAVLTLLRSGGERDPLVVAAAAGALAGMSVARGCAEPAGFDDILKLFSSQNPAIRVGAATALGRLGEAALPHAKHLLKCMTDRCPQVKIEATKALVGLGVRGQVYAADVARLACDEWQTASVRTTALKGLLAMGERGAAFADDVVQLLGSSDEEVREAAETTLEQWGIGTWELQQCA